MTYSILIASPCSLAQALVQLQPGLDELRFAQPASRYSAVSAALQQPLTLCLAAVSAVPLSDSRDTASLIAWIRSRADCHILHHEQLVLYHSQQLSQWTALKQAVDSASSPASSPLSPLRSSPLKKGRGADSVREEVRRRFGSVMAGWKWEEKSGKKDRKAGKENAAISARDIEHRLAGSGGNTAIVTEAAVTKTPDSRGVKFAAQAVVIGEGEVPVVDDRRRNDGSAEKQRAKAQQQHDDDAAAQEQKEQPQQQQDDIVLPSPAAKEAPASPKLVLPSLSGLLAERDDDASTAAANDHSSAAQPTASNAPAALPTASAAPAPALSAASSAAARLSPFLQFHPSLRDHPYHQQLIQTPPPPPPSLSIASPPARAHAPPAAPALPPPPPPPRSLPPKKKPEAAIAASPPPLQSSVSTVRFRVDTEMPMTAADESTTVLLHTSSGLMSPSAAAAQVMSPPPLPPRRPAAALLSPSPQSASRAPPSGAFCYLTPSQLAVSSNGSGAAGSRHRRQRSKSVDLTAARSS